MRLPKIEKFGKKTSSEIDKLVRKAINLTPDELSEFLHSKFIEDFQYFKRLIMEHRERLEWAREKPPIQHLLKKIKDFYDDLITDGYLKRDLSLFEKNKIEEYKVGQAREEAANLLLEIDRTKEQHYKEIFRKWNKVYANNYETLCNLYLVELAQKICGKAVKNKSRVLRILSSYRNGKNVELFKSLIPQIRNSIQHQDFIIDPKEPKITFFDRKKRPLKLTIEEYADSFWESFYLMIAFDIAYFDMQSGIIDIFLEAIDTVDSFLKKHDLKWVEGGQLSILDWATLIKSGKIS